MSADRAPDRLSRISTLWTELARAHGLPGDERAVAQQRLTERYAAAMHRYLLAALGRPDAADEVLQEFLLALVRGDFHKVSGGRGRFRDYVKTVLFHLVQRHRAAEGRRPRPLADDHPAWEDLAAGAPEQATFEGSLREELMACAGEALSRQHPAMHEALTLRAAHPKDSSQDLARRLGDRLKRPVAAPALRQLLHRARALFCDLLLAEVAAALQCTERADLEEELGQLNLLSYCQDALERRFGPAGA